MRSPSGQPSSGSEDLLHRTLRENPNVITSERLDWKARLKAELKKTVMVFVYLALFFGAFTTYRRMLLAQYQVSYLHYGSSLVEALVLSKIIVLGDALRIGERFGNRPLIVPTLYKALWFSLLILTFSVCEHLLVGWMHGKNVGAVFRENLSDEIWEVLARTLVKVLAILPLLAVWQIGRTLGEGKLFELFFINGTSLSHPDCESRKQ